MGNSAYNEALLCLSCYLAPSPMKEITICTYLKVQKHRGVT